MFFKHFIRILGCLFVIAAMALLVWLPSTPWATLTISSPVTTPVTFSVTGYDGFILADSAMGVSKFVERTSAALGSDGEAVQAAIGVPTSLRLMEPFQTILDQLGQTIWLFIGVQVTMVVLILLTAFVALIVLFSSSNMTWQMLRGILLLILTLATIAMLAGGFFYLSQLFDAALPDIQSNLPSGVITIELTNTMNWRLAAAASIGGLLGALAALLGAVLTAKSSVYAMPLYSIPTQAFVDVNQPVDNFPVPISNEPLAPTIRLVKEPVAKEPVAKEPVVALLTRRCLNCASENGLNARFCNKCGKRL